MHKNKTLRMRFMPACACACIGGMYSAVFSCKPSEKYTLFLALHLKRNIGIEYSFRRSYSHPIDGL